MGIVWCFKTIKSLVLRSILSKRYNLKFKFVESYNDFILRGFKESEVFGKDFLDLYMCMCSSNLSEEEIVDMGYEIISEDEDSEYLDVTFH